MARRRKHRVKRSGHRRGRRVRGAGMDAVLLVIGGLVGGIGLMAASSKWTVLAGKVAGILEIGLGTIAAWKVGNMFVKGLGVGLAVAGGYNTGKNFNLITGIGATREFRNGQSMMGFRDVPKVGQAQGFPKPNVVGKADTKRMYGGVYR